MEIYFVSSNGITVICDNRKSVLEWVHMMIENGMAPSVRLATEEEMEERVI